ncbi:YbhB/YbcL family Raf kinase inhibitor-like protein [Bordetella genomosp. 9]|uniref:Phosphatidylethanolamine-binding protein n=1 Tax=Bordetella genomosp. 9 TaxID=1416803 RepID=A0A1W6YXU0_9BORD|nr:YbhB/YbcL family Raf kinase inhibitor-like protein [Bordetella genomosp. 9]ARP85423.1 hypothetical protein CAL13_03715 [Bordetella genomosp. 9]ARP89402.1 hypothetical protein CAL14_03080 [Bordetella genomosp. 9]
MIRSMRFPAAAVSAGALCLSALLPLPARAAPPAFSLEAKGLRDNGNLSRANAGNGKDGAGAMCGGDNVSPELTLGNPPAGTRSFAVTVYDPDGGRGLGFVHWVLYDIPASTKSLPRGIGTKGPAGAVSGVNGTRGSGYYGPCPPMGDKPHHYIFQAYALDIEPGTLKAGLTRDALIEEMRGHVLGSASVMLRYGRPAKGR